MISVKLLKEKVKQLFEDLGLVDPEIKFIDHFGIKLLVQLVSPSFETMDEGDRQTLVWGKLLDELPDSESRMVEFVYTDSPSEVREAETASRASD